MNNGLLSYHISGMSISHHDREKRAREWLTDGQKKTKWFKYEKKKDGDKLDQTQMPTPIYTHTPMHRFTSAQGGEEEGRRADGS